MASLIIYQFIFLMIIFFTDVKLELETKSSKEELVDLISRSDTSQLFENKDEILSKNETNKLLQTSCTRSNLTNFEEINSVQLVNGSRLTMYLSLSNPTDCFFVLFFVPWCPFSTKLAPIFNALPRAFERFDILAFDVSKSVGYNTKFGTSAVPMLLMFQHKNVLSKFNYTNKNLTDYIEFVSNITGFQPNKSIEIEVADTIGPVPTVTSKRFDYYLFYSWLFLVFVSIDLILRKTQIKIIITKYIKSLFNYNYRLLYQIPQRPMIQTAGHENQTATTNHLHND